MSLTAYLEKLCDYPLYGRTTDSFAPIEAPLGRFSRGQLSSYNILLLLVSPKNSPECAQHDHLLFSGRILLHHIATRYEFGFYQMYSSVDLFGLFH